MKTNEYLKLLRPEQYYKNLVVFLALYFSGNLLNTRLLELTAGGFILLCLLSSANYIINDIADRERDRHNKEKQGRPLASGSVSIPQAIIAAAALAAASLGISYMVNREFFIVAAAMLALASLYSFILKKELFLDIIAISFNYVLRAIAGAVLIGVWVSPWLVVGTFFLALFLATGKRKSEKILLEEKAKRHRTLLDLYSSDMLSFLLHMSATVLLVSYALYSFLGTSPQLVFTLPIALYMILRYLYLAETGSPAARALSKVFSDKRIMAAAGLYFAISIFVIYRQ